MKTIFVFLLLCLYGISMQAARPISRIKLHRVGRMEFFLKKKS